MKDRTFEYAKSKKVSPEFVYMLNCLSIDEVIELKLRSLLKLTHGTLQGILLYDYFFHLVEKAFVNVIRDFKTLNEASKCLGVSKKKLIKIMEKMSSEGLEED